VLLPVVVIFWYKDVKPSFYYPLIDLLSPFNLTILAKVLSGLLNLFIPFIGIGAIFSIHLSDNSNLAKIFIWLGLITMDIYVIHQFFLFPIGVVPAFLVSLTFAILFSYLVRKSRVLSAILLGKV
jgi:hypothetical protein